MRELPPELTAIIRSFREDMVRVEMQERLDEYLYMREFEEVMRDIRGNVPKYTLMLGDLPVSIYSYDIRSDSGLWRLFESARRRSRSCGGITTVWLR